MTRGGPPLSVAEVVALARRNAGVAEPPRIDESSAPPSADSNLAPEDPREAGADGGDDPAVGARGSRPSGLAQPPSLPVYEPKYCSSCSAPILWAQLLDDDGQRQKTPSGRMKSIPVDFEPVAGGNVVVFHRPGQGIVCRVLKRGEQPPPGARTRVSHFATCPQAKQHRRKQ